MIYCLHPTSEALLVCPPSRIAAASWLKTHVLATGLCERGILLSTGVRDALHNVRRHLAGRPWLWNLRIGRAECGRLQNLSMSASFILQRGISTGHAYSHLNAYDSELGRLPLLRPCPLLSFSSSSAPLLLFPRDFSDARMGNETHAEDASISVLGAVSANASKQR